jgi:hypothetical protein
MSRTHEQSSNQRDYRGESSQEGAQRRVAPLDVVRQQALQPQEASERKAPSSLQELTFLKILEVLEAKDLVEEDTSHRSYSDSKRSSLELNRQEDPSLTLIGKVVSGILSKEELEDRIFEKKEWKAWLDKHGVEFFNTPVGSKCFEKHRFGIFGEQEREAWLDKHGVKFFNTPVGSEWFKEHGSRLFETEKWKAWLDKHCVEFFNTSVGSEWFKEHGSRLFEMNEWETWLDKHGRAFFDTPVGSKWLEKHASEWCHNICERYADSLVRLPCSDAVLA